MRTTLVIEDGLLARLDAIGKFKTRREAVEAAILEFVTRRERLALAAMKGKVKFFPDHLHVIDTLEGQEP